MSSDRTWPTILKLMSPETRFFGLIALLAEGALIAVAATLPSGQRIYAFGIFVFLLVLLVLMVVASRQVITQSKSHDNNPPLQLKVRQLREKLIAKDFLPQLIVAISRGGLGVAGMLAKQLGDEPIVPVIALTRRGPGEFENRFNTIKFTRDDFDAGRKRTVNVLIVDDICRSGRTLADAKAYLEAATDGNDFFMETAALSFYAQSNAIPPSFFAEKAKDPIRDASGELEPLLE